MTSCFSSNSQQSNSMWNCWTIPSYIWYVHWRSIKFGCNILMHLKNVCTTVVWTKWKKHFCYNFILNKNISFNTRFPQILTCGLTVNFVCIPLNWCLFEHIVWKFMLHLSKMINAEPLTSHTDPLRCSESSHLRLKITEKYPVFYFSLLKLSLKIFSVDLLINNPLSGHCGDF